MKKFTKGMLIAAGIFAAAGIGLTAAGGVMGASMSELTGVNSLKRILRMTEWDDDHDDYDDIDDDHDDHDDHDDIDDDYDDHVEHDGMEYSTEMGQKDMEPAAVGNKSSTDGTVYQLKYQPTKLDIELKYDELILEEGDSFCVRVYDDNGKNVTVKESSDTLKVRSTKKLSKTRKVCISYPEDVKLQELELSLIHI